VTGVGIISGSSKQSFLYPQFMTVPMYKTDTICRVEMHVGIIASCLPTLKPLFASVFGQISMITKGRTTGSGGLNSAPFRSNGYMKHNDRANNNFAMKNLSEGSQSTGRDPYAEDAVLGKETYTVEAGRGMRSPGLSRSKSQAGESDESILSHHERQREGRRTSAVVPRGMTIVRTTEVNITR
jgi:hypothetical protein